MVPTEYALRTRIVFGNGSVSELGGMLLDLGTPRVLLVTDPGLVRAGHVTRMEARLAAAGLAVTRFEGVHENPDEDDVEACAAVAREMQPDVLVGLGGGSALDVAKGAAFLLAGGGRMADYWGKGKAKGTLLPIVAVPTTAGTGSEMQSFALIGHRENHQKMACGDPQAAPRVALLDPELTLSMPRAVTACTGLDTLAHALESAVTLAATEVSNIYSEDGFVRVVRSLPVVLSSPKNLGARGDMMLAAAHAGLAIEHSMLGAAHSMANPLTAHHGIAHGQAVGMVLPAVVAFNAAEPSAAARYRALTIAAGLCAEDASERDAIAVLVARLRDLVTAAGFPESLAGCGVAAPAAMALAVEAARQWTAQFNPRTVGEAEFRELFAAASAPVAVEEG